MRHALALGFLGVLALGFVLWARSGETQAASTIQVPTDYSTIQAAIDASVDGDIIAVDRGTYAENLDFHGRAVELMSTAGPQATVLDGGDIKPAITFRSGEGLASVVRGFTIRNGNSTFTDYVGGGILVRDSSPSIMGNVIQDNQTCSGGGGIGIVNGSPAIENNEIRNNRQSTCTGGIGGAISVYGGSPQIEGNLIEGTRGDGSASGIGLMGPGNAAIVNNIIRDNGKGSCAGGISITFGASATILQNVITGNESETAGAICVGVVDPPVVIANNTIGWNYAPDEITFSAFPTGSAALVANNIVAGSIFCAPPGLGQSAPTLLHNNMYAGSGAAYKFGCASALGTAGNISAAPSFEDPVSGDFRLGPGSPSIDQGDSTESHLMSTDIEGLPRVVDGNGDTVAVVDQGAYEASSGVFLTPTATPTIPAPTATPPSATYPAGTPGYIDTYRIVQGPYSVDVAPNGEVYVVTSSCAILRISDGGMNIVASCYPGLPGIPTVDSPSSVLVGPYGDILIAERCAVRRLAAGVLETIAGGRCGSFGDGGPATLAGINGPSALAIDVNGDLFIAERGDCLIRRVRGGIIDRIAGNGICGYSGDGGLATAASLYNPQGLIVDGEGATYFSEAGTGYCRIRKVKDGIISTVAGTGDCSYSGDGGPANQAGMNPAGLDIRGSKLYVVDFSNARLRVIENGIINTIAGREFATPNGYGDGGPATLAAFWSPVDVSLDGADNIYIADQADWRIRIVYSGSSPTPTPTPTATSTATMTTTATPSATASPTRTPSAGCADLDGDGQVTLGDVNVLISAVRGGSYDHRFDLNQDGRITGRDVAEAARAFGTTCP